MKRLSALCLALLSLNGCNKPEAVRKNTLSDFVVGEEKIIKNKTIEVSSDKAKKSYQSYLSSSGLKNENKKKALQRLAEIELDISISSPTSNKDTYNKDSIYIFKKRLLEFPKDKDNDRIYYQLANAYAISGNETKKISILEKLTDNYPESIYYIESMFRLGESYLTKNNYIDAELALTSVIVEDKTNKFRKNALFKRAWSRYKQLNYDAALNDYNVLLSYFPEGKSKNRADQEFLNNIYKVYGVCVSYLGIKPTLSTLHDAIKSNHVRYYIYSNLANLLIKQDRYIDASSVYDLFLSHENDDYVNQVVVSLSKVWLNYKNRKYAMEKLLYLDSMLSNGVVKRKLDSNTISALANNLVQVSQFYHSLYQKSDKVIKDEYLAKALDAYSRLINKFKHNDSAEYNYLYAELLNESGSISESIINYERTINSYNNITFREKSSYSLLLHSNKLYKSDKISFNEYARLNDTYMKYLSIDHVYKPLISYISFLYNMGDYTKVVSSVNELQSVKKSNNPQLTYILASSYFETKQYNLSEKNYSLLRTMKHVYKDIDKRLALSIFKQADQYKEESLILQSISKYKEIYDKKLDHETVLLSQIEICGLYMRIGKWSSAEKQLNFVRKTYPDNKFSNDVTRMLSIVYLNSDKNLFAAIEFEKIYKSFADKNLKRNSLWQAAELYEKGGDLVSSVRMFKKYAKTYKIPLALNVEAKYKLTSLYKKLNMNKKRNYWLDKIIVTTDKAGKYATERMKFLASKSSLILARSEYKRFASVKLTVPLKVSLRKKKKILKNTISSLKNVNKYNRYDHISESIYWIAETYYDFSENLMKSERPKNLSELELEQYNVLLEDQAIPFEDQAIRFLIQNTKLSKNQVYGKWMDKSFDKLSMLYPSKYRRVELLDSQVNSFY